MSTLSNLIGSALSETNTEIERSVVSRRRIMKQAGALAGAAALLGGSQLAASAGNATTLEIDVACDGRTWRHNHLDGPGGTVKRGDTFIVNGKVYPAGTISQGLSGPSQAGGIGTWICRGWFYHGLEEIIEGAVPHVITTQLYLFDNFDGLVTDGAEGGEFVVRSITGGYGKYSGARGVATEVDVEENDTLITLGEGIQVPATNIRFAFELEQ